MSSDKNKNENNNNTPPENSSAQALLLLDRFSASASSTASDDQHEALLGLYKELRGGTLQPSTLISASSDDDSTTVWKGLLQIVQQQQQDENVNDNDNSNDVHQACTRVVLEMNRYLLQQAQQNKSSGGSNCIIVDALLEQPTKGQWLEAWVDIACSSSNTTSSYTRVLALQCLQLLLQAQPQRAQEQLLSAPNALHRLGGDLLGGQNVEDVVRNEALLLAATVTQQSAAASKIWIFIDLPQHLLGMCLTSSSGLGEGLTGGNVLVLDCLHILHNMLAHDATAAQLVWQSSQSSFAQGLAQLLDLRKGIEFVKPGSVSRSAATATATAAAAVPTTKSNSKDENDDDDLDDLIASGSSKDKTAASGGGSEQSPQPQMVPIPRLTAPEEDIIRCVLDLIQMLLQQQETLNKDATNNNAWRDSFFQKEHILVSVIWDLALVAPPLPGMTAPCSMPSNQLQRHALHVTASVLNDVTTCTRLSGMDRLLYLSCTGRGGGSETTTSLEDRWSMSLAAVHVLRQTFHATAQDYLLHALAPPPDMHEGADNREAQELAQKGQVVPRLLLTVQGYLRQVADAESAGKEKISQDVLVGLMGSLLALGVFVQENEASRSMLLKLTNTLQQQQQAQQAADESSPPPSSLLDDLFQALSSLSILQQDQDLLQSESEPQEQVSVCILRFLGEWMQGASMVVQAFLSHATSSTILPGLLLSSNSSSASRQGLTALILGLSMAYLEDERKCGGWTRDTLLDLLLVRNKTSAASGSSNASGLASLTTQLNAVVKDQKNKVDGLLPWWRDEMEATVWSEWYQDAVWTVRKCVVRELTLSSSSSFSSDDKRESSDDKENAGDASPSPEDDEEDAEPVDMARYRALQTLVSQQSKDLDQVRQALGKAEKQVSSQEKQLTMWQKRVESTPTELDRILTESTTRNTELEQTVVDLKEELATEKAKYQDEIKSRDETITSLQKELLESKAREDECRQERDSLREDMSGLSAAYSNLEEEYRRCQQATAAAGTTVEAVDTTSTPPGEGGREDTDDRNIEPVVHEQPQGEASEQIPSSTAASSTAAVTAASTATATAAAGSTEVATLRAENSRLRNDARAAEEWMAMAVERLGDMNTRNTTLEQQVQSMEEEMEALRSSETQHSEGQDQRLAEERELRVHAEQEMAELSAALHASLQEERGRRAEIEVTAAQAQEAAENSLAEEQDRRAQAEAALAQAHDQMQTIHDQLSKERDDARAQVSRLEEQLAQQTPAVSEEQSAQAQAQVLALQNTIDSLNEQLAAAQAQANDQMQTKQEEIYRHESRIRELESKLGDGLGTYTVEDIHSRDEELQQLRESNEAAQAWMSKAVEHHNLLSEQLADLSNENSSLKSKVQELTVKESATSAIEDLQRDLSNRDEELACVNAQLSTKEQELQELVASHAEEMKTITHQLAQSTAEVEMLRAGLKAEEVKIQQLADQSEGSSMVEEELRATTDELVKKVKMKEFELEEAKAQVAAMDMEVAELKADLALETEEKDDALAQVERLRKELQVETENVQKEGESLTSDRQQIEALESALAEARERLEGDENVLHQWEDRVAELEATMKDLENQLESQTQDASDAIAQWQDRCSKLEGSAVETSESDHEQADRIAELEALLKHRGEQLEEAEQEAGNVVAQWEQSYLDLEKQLEQAQEELIMAKKSKEDVLLAKEGETITQIAHAENELQAQSMNKAALRTQHQTEIDRLTAAISEIRVELDESNKKRLKLEEERDAALNTLETSEREADDVVNEWEESYNDIRQQLTQLEEEHRVLAEEKESAVAREQAKVVEIEELQSQLTERDNRLSELGQTLGERESVVDETIAKVTSYESEVEGLSQQTETLTKERDALQEQLAQVERDSHQIVQQWKERSDTIEQELVKLQGELQTSNDEKEGAVARDQASSALVTELEGRISDMESNVAQLSDKCEQYEATVADLGRKNDDLKSQADDYTDKISALELAVEEGRAAADENSKNANAYREQLSSLHEQVTQAQNELRLAAEAREDATVHEQEKSMLVSDLEEKLRQQQEKAAEELAAEQEKHDAAVAVRDETINELQSQLQDHTDKLSSLELELQEGRTALVDSLETCASQKDEIEQLQQQIGSLTTEKEALEATIEEEQRESEDVVSQWEESYNTLQEQLTQAQNELRLALEDREDASVHEQEKSIQVSDLEAKLRLQQEKASEELSAAQEKHHTELAARDQTIGELQSQLTEVSDKLSSLEREVEDGRTELDKGLAKVASEEHEVESFQEQIAQLSSEKETLEAQLEDEQRDAEEVILQWEESYNALSQTLEQAQEDLRLACEHKDEATARESQTKSQVDELTEQLVQARDELQKSLQETGGASIREQELSKQVENLETQLDEAKHKVAVLDKEKNDYLDREQDQLVQITELQEQARKHQTASNELLTDLQQREVSISERDHTIGEQQSQLVELENVISELRQSAEQQQSDHVEIVDGLEERAAASELEVKNLSEKIETLIQDRDALQEKLEQATEGVESSVSHWEAKHNDVSQQLKLAREELSVATAEKDEAAMRAEQLQTQIEELKESFSAQESKAAEALSVERKDHEDAIANLNFTLDELRSKVTEQAEEYLALEHASREQQEQEMSVADELRKTVDAKTLEIESLEQRIQGLIDERNDFAEQTEAQTSIAAESQRQSSAEDDLQAAKRDLENLRIESDETIRLWTERVEELETTVRNLQAENDATQADAEESISIWESQCMELQLKVSSCEEREAKLEAELQELRSQNMDGPTTSGHVSPSDLEVERESRKAAEARISSLQKKLEEAEEKFSSFRETAVSEQAKAQSSDDAQRLLERERVESLEREFDELRGSKAALEEERDGLKLLVSELEHELNEANDALQFHVTNEVSEQATRIAADALRHQIDEMRAQADADHTDLQAAQSARLVAEKEVTQLRGDLAALLGMEDNEENLSEIQRRTIEATEHFQRKERAEIEELKNALARAVEELDKSRATVAECEERAGKADLQTSMVEQELVTAKTDLQFLSRTIEEMRDAESSRRVTLENRIASLETDHGVLRKFHSAEVENIRNELNQVTMEKDRLAQCLKESEKSRESLMQASSRGQNQNGEVSLEMEVRMLRMEQAQLLAAVEEEAARGERRLREARAAEKSSKEADVFVEKELRLAAERNLKNANKELEELRAEVGRNAANHATSNSNALGELTNTVDELRGRVHLLSDENTDLKAQLEATKNEAATTIQRLNEECRNARARASQLEREGRQEAEIRAEVARLQASETSKENPALSSWDDDSANGPSHYNEQAQQDTTETVARLYDMIEEQQQAMIEERQVHVETNKDFEDCLAMLAQRALIVRSLQEALTQAAGAEAVDAAIRQAEEQAVAEHGNFVRENE